MTVMSITITWFEEACESSHFKFFPKKYSMRTICCYKRAVQNKIENYAAFFLVQIKYRETL